MGSPFGDDAQFPDRPTHPDFWRLSETVLQLDGASAEGGESFEDTAEDRIDLASLNYMAEQRAMLLCQKAGLPPIPHFLATLHAMFTTAVITGIVFERKGGTRSEGGPGAVRP